MQNQLQRAINLAKKTGDRLIIFDNIKAEEAYVVLSLKDYENLVLGRSEVRGLTEDELLDKINRDIAIWKSEQDFSDSFSKYEPIGIHSTEIFTPGIRPEKPKAKAWSIPENRKQSAEEIIEEDRQYLEEV